MTCRSWSRVQWSAAEAASLVGSLEKIQRGHSVPLAAGDGAVNVNNVIDAGHKTQETNDEEHDAAVIYVVGGGVNIKGESNARGI